MLTGNEIMREQRNGRITMEATACCRNNLSASLSDIGFEGQWTYQGSVGPRSSDIHKAFIGKLARSRFPGLDAPPSPDQVGAKFASLAAAFRHLPVPAVVAIPAAEFADPLGAGPMARLSELFTDLEPTVGAFFIDSTAQIADAVADLRFGDGELLLARLAAVFGDLDTVRFAVRSSGLAEDGATSSLAGVHHSALGVRADEVVAAVEECLAVALRRPGDRGSGPGR